MPTFCNLNEAVTLVQNGDTLALGGLALNRSPMAFTIALLQRATPPQAITLLAFTAGYAADLLVGAGCVQTVRSVYFGLEVFGFAPMFTYHANRGSLNILEETETSLVLGLRASINHTGYLPSQVWQGTDLLKLRPDVQSILDPYSGETVTAFPAIHINVAVIHALYADRAGNIALNNNLGLDLLLAYNAKTVIVTYEEQVEQLHPAPHLTILPAPAVHYCCHAPQGASPTSCYPRYPMQGGTLLDYASQVSDPASFHEYLHRAVIMAS
ncbi:MAG: CoA transferase subunit A [Phototrophicaceae bacterium]|jgi:glutaconate CoA-transferase subunit A